MAKGDCRYVGYGAAPQSLEVFSCAIVFRNLEKAGGEKEGKETI